MRSLERPPLPGWLAGHLAERARRVRRPRAHAARYAIANAEWEKAGKKALKTILIEMNGGHDRCMYCEYSEAGTVDHFCPRAVDPKQAFHWRNLILACGRCQTQKGARFSASLLNPARRGYRPWDHLDFEPSTGVIVSESIAATASEPIYGWNHGLRPTYRWKSFLVMQAAILAHAQARRAGDSVKAEQQMRLAQAEAHPGIFDWILYFYDQGPPLDRRLDPRVRQALTDFPDIRGWLR